MSRPLKGKYRRVPRTFTLDPENTEFLNEHYPYGGASDFVNSLISIEAWKLKILDTVKKDRTT